MSTSHAEGLRLLRADNKAGYFGVYHNPGKPKPATLAARDTIKMSEPEAGLLMSNLQTSQNMPRARARLRRRKLHARRWSPPASWS